MRIVESLHGSYEFLFLIVLVKYIVKIIDLYGSSYRFIIFRIKKFLYFIKFQNPHYFSYKTTIISSDLLFPPSAFHQNLLLNNSPPYPSPLLPPSTSPFHQNRMHTPRVNSDIFSFSFLFFYFVGFRSTRLKSTFHLM